MDQRIADITPTRKHWASLFRWPDVYEHFRTEAPSSQETSDLVQDQLIGLPDYLSMPYKGSGIQNVPKGVYKAALMTLCHRTIAIEDIRSSATFDVVNSTVNHGLRISAGVLDPVLLPGTAAGARPNRANTGFSINNKGEILEI